MRLRYTDGIGSPIRSSYEESFVGNHRKTTRRLRRHRPQSTEKPKRRQRRIAAAHHRTRNRTRLRQSVRTELDAEFPLHPPKRFLAQRKRTILFRHLLSFRSRMPETRRKAALHRPRLTVRNDGEYTQFDSRIPRRRHLHRRASRQSVADRNRKAQKVRCMHRLFQFRLPLSLRLRR